MFPIIIAVILALTAIAFFFVMPGEILAKRSPLLHEDSDAHEDETLHSSPQFPTILGRNVNGRLFKLPDEFESLYNIVLIAYDKHQFLDADEWKPHIRDIESTYPDIRAYRLPVVAEISWFMRERLEFWMSSDIIDPMSRANTITLYTDVRSFNRNLNIPNTDEIVIALVDRYGNVLWSEHGEFESSKAQDLEDTIVNLLTNVRIYADT